MGHFRQQCAAVQGDLPDCSRGRCGRSGRNGLYKYSFLETEASWLTELTRHLQRFTQALLLSPKQWRSAQVTQPWAWEPVAKRPTGSQEANEAMGLPGVSQGSSQRPAAASLTGYHTNYPSCTPALGTTPKRCLPKPTVTRAPKYSSRKKCFLNNFHLVLSRSGLPRLSRFES